MRPHVVIAVLLLVSVRAFPAVEVGSAAPEINLDLLLPSQPPANASLRALAGKAIVLEFWATWCAPCIDSIPHLNQLAEQFHDRPIQFLSVTDEEPSLVQDFLKKKPIGGWVGFDRKKQLFKSYGFSGIPKTVLIDAAGKVAGIAHPVLIRATVLEDLLAGKPLSLPKSSPPSVIAVSRADSETAPPPLLDILIRPSTSGTATGSTTSKTKFEMKAVTLKNLLAVAYGVPIARVEGEPVEDSIRYDFLVAVPKGKAGDLKPVMRTAIGAAFQVTVTSETRETEVMILKAPNGKPEGLKETVSTGGSGARGGGGTLSLIGYTLSGIASEVQRVVGKPVVDETGLAGRYDLELKWDQNRPESLLEIVKGLGIVIERGRRPVEYLVVKKL